MKTKCFCTKPCRIRCGFVYEKQRRQKDMDIKFVSNDYIFRYGACLMTAKMGTSSDSAIIDFFIDNERVYYYLIPKKDTELLDDLSIIHKAVESMQNDKDRWIGDCSLYLDNMDKFILYERATVYKVKMNEFMHKYATVTILEENNSRFMLTLVDEMTGIKMITHMYAESRNELIDTMDSIARLIIQMLKPFREKQELVVLNAFGTDFALRQSAAIVDSYEYGKKRG